MARSLQTPRLPGQNKTELLRKKAQERPLELPSAHVVSFRSVIPISALEVKLRSRGFDDRPWREG